MKYRIGDVSKILGLSDQMIRYYEKCGVLNPERSGDGRYRYYTDMDIFMLFDAMRYKEWGINIAEIGDLVANDYYDRLILKLQEYRRNLDQEIAYKEVLKRRVAWMERRLTLCRYNTRNIWVDLLPECYIFRSGESRGEVYDLFTDDTRMTQLIYSSRNISFFDPFAEFKGDHCTWWYIIRREFLEALSIPLFGEYRLLEASPILTTVMDMGNPGDFDGVSFPPLQEYAAKHGYREKGPLFGIIIGRGKENEQFHRMMQVCLPIESL
jgi:DNA-binding transcriptional MerR regulator